jgi:hypothetical protein
MRPWTSHAPAQTSARSPEAIEMSQICFAGRYGAALLVNPMWTCLLRSTGLLLVRPGKCVPAGTSSRLEGDGCWSGRTLCSQSYLFIYIVSKSNCNWLHW